MGNVPYDKFRLKKKSVVSMSKNVKKQSKNDTFAHRA